MPRSKQQSPAGLPRVSEEWLVAQRLMRIWIGSRGQTPHRPYGVLVITQRGLVRALELYDQAPTTDDLRNTLFNAMLKPIAGGGKAVRPSTIVVPDVAVARALAAALRDKGLDMEVSANDAPPEVEEIFRAVETFERGGEPEVPGLLASRSVTPELVGEFFSAAAAFYRAAPWVTFGNYDIVGVQHPAEENYRFTIVMGQGGIEYGMATLPSWKDVEYFFTSGARPDEKLARGTYHSLFFDEIDLLPFDDIDAVEAHSWEVAAPNAYPIVLKLESKDKVSRPSRRDLEWYIGALRAIPLLAEVVERQGKNSEATLERSFQVPIGGELVAMKLKFPAGVLPREELPVFDSALDLSEDEDAAAVPAFDRRMMEGVMAGIGAEAGAERLLDDPALYRAQELMYEAFETRNPAKRIALAHDALELSPKCADAWVLLAEEEADTVKRAHEYYRRGVEAGEQALGEQFFEKHRGHFWLILETRPYMRALKGMADTFWRMNRKDQALEYYQKMLALNPNDNQGVRDLVVALLLEANRPAELESLLDRYREDTSAVFAYTRALTAFRRGDRVANRYLREAFRHNPYVPPYLTGDKRVPPRQPEYIGLGDDTEARFYAGEHLNHWRRTPGAVEWVRAEWAKGQAEGPSRRGRKTGAKPKAKR